MGALAIATARRWFPEDSIFYPVESNPNSNINASNLIIKMVATTPVLGFEAGARALQRYDLLGDGLLQSRMETLLVAGEKDGGGTIAKGLRQLRQDWEGQGGDVNFAEVRGAGHLPMVDKREAWLEIVCAFLET